MHLYGFVGHLNTKCTYRQIGTYTYVVHIHIAGTCTHVIHIQTSGYLSTNGAHTDKGAPAHMWFTYRQAGTCIHVVHIQTSGDLNTHGAFTDTQEQTYT